MLCSIGLSNFKYFFVMCRWSTAFNKPRWFFNAPKHVRFERSKIVSTTRGAVASSFVCELLLPTEGARSAKQKPKHTHTKGASDCEIQWGSGSWFWNYAADIFNWVQFSLIMIKSKGQFSANTHYRHPIAHPWGRDMGCLLWPWTWGGGYEVGLLHFVIFSDFMRIAKTLFIY